jgi:hypothetical protein
MMGDNDRVTFRLSTGQEIFIGFRETPRQKRDRKRDEIVMAECERFDGVISRPEHRRATTRTMWQTMTGLPWKEPSEHPPECRCDDCVPF